MEKINYKYEKFVKCLFALEKTIPVLECQNIPEYLEDYLLTSLIKHYKRCYKSRGEYLKSYLETKYKIKLDSPKKVIRECYKLQIIDKNTAKELFKNNLLWL